MQTSPPCELELQPTPPGNETSSISGRRQTSAAETPRHCRPLAAARRRAGARGPAGAGGGALPSRRRRTHSAAPSVRAPPSLHGVRPTPPAFLLVRCPQSARGSWFPDPSSAAWSQLTCRVQPLPDRALAPRGGLPPRASASGRSAPAGPCPEPLTPRLQRLRPVSALRVRPAAAGMLCLFRVRVDALGGVFHLLCGARLV